MKNISSLRCMLIMMSLLLFSTLLLAQKSKEIMGDPPENFYVCPTSLATWDAVSKSSQEFFFYKVFIDGVWQADVDSTSYVFDEYMDLIPGESYLAEIAALYSDGMSEKTSYEFTYLPCDSFPAHTGFNIYVENNNLHFYWDQVEEDVMDIFLGTHFYFEGELMGFIPASDTSYIYPDPGPGYYTYCFYRVYSYDNGIHSWETCIDHACLYDAGYPEECFPPTHLEAYYNADNNIHLSWDAPTDFNPVWLQYDDGINVDGIGGPEEFSYAARWDPNQLEGFDNAMISKINFFPREEGSIFTLKIWKGDNASILIYEQELSNLIFDQWNEFELNQNIPIDVTEQLWIGFHVQTSGYPAGVGNYTGNSNSDLITLDGELWEHLSDYGLNFCWNLAVFCEGGSGKMVSLPSLKNNLIKDPSHIPIEIGKLPLPLKPFLDNKSTKEMIGYKIYMDGIQINETLVEETYYDHEFNLNYEICYQVTAVYSIGGESAPSNQACVFPWAVTDIDLSCHIYPNPAKNQLFIESTEIIINIQLFNQLGKLMMAEESINSKTHRLELEKLSNGIYFIEIETKSGIQTSKIIIHK